MKKRGQIQIGAIIIVVLIFVGMFFLMNKSTPGVLVSCEDHEAISVRNTGGQLMAVVQPEYCEVEFSVYSEGVEICADNFTIRNSEKGIIPCKELKEHKGEFIQISTKYFEKGIETGNQRSRSLLVDF